METKFHLLPVGQHFEWEGKRYVKTTPLIASQLPEGGQKFMPRAALVTVIGTAPAMPAVEPPTCIDSTTLRAALARYHQQLVHISQSSRATQPQAVIDEVKQALEQLYRELLDELKL